MKEVRGDEEGAAPYRLIRVVGSGGMGVVHEAWDTRLDRRVALKMLHPHLLEHGDVSARFEREARKAARIEHPNVVRVYRVDTIDGRVAIEMQFIEGTPLNKLLRSGPLSPEQAADLLRQVLDALEACHAQGVIHCDLKPGNLVVTHGGHVVLTDFGIARALYDAGAAETAPDSLSGPLWGTPQYSPPEAWTGEAVTSRWDLYAAGALVYEAVSGAPPFRGQTPAALMNAILSTSPPPLKAEWPEVSGAFSDLVESLMARDPEARPASARASLAILRETPEFGLHAPDTEPLQISARPERLDRDATASGTRIAPRFTRSRWGWTLSLVVLATLLAVGFAYRNNRPRETRTDDAPEAPVTITSRATELFIVQDEALFAAEDSAHGWELWSVHYSKGARLAADIAPGPDSSNPRRFMMRRGGFVFAATTPEAGEELWYGQSNNGEYDVRMIKDIIPGPMGSDPEPVAANETLVLFYATTLAAGRELWCTNTTSEQQTAMVADVFPGVDGSVPMRPRVYSDAGGAYIVAIADVRRGCVLFHYDYATHSLREVGDVAEDAGGMAKAGRRLVFSNADEAHGWEVWVHDESTREFGILADLWPGPESSNPSQFATWGDRVLFQARTKESGTELWISDGTAAGTNQIADINPGPGDSDPYGFVVAGDRVFFRAKDDACGRELWVTDGTERGTMRVADLWPGSDSGEPYNLVARGNGLFFTASDGVHGEELWWTGPVGDTWQPSLVADLYPGPLGAEPHNLRLASDGCAYFWARTPETGVTVFRLPPGFPPKGAAVPGAANVTITPLPVGPGTS